MTPAPALPAPSDRSYAAHADGVLFTVPYGGHDVRCLVTRQALATYFGADDGDADAEQACVRAYDASAPAILAIARRLIGDDDQPPAGAIVMTVKDVFRAVNARPQNRARAAA